MELILQRYYALAITRVTPTKIITNTKAITKRSRREIMAALLED
jgi:hypothetical protein